MIVEQKITEKLTSQFCPEHMEVVNESHMHAVPPNSETHFKVVLVTRSFDNQRQVKRHQQVYDVLSEELSGGVHALALHTYTPDEWAQRTGAPVSPKCRGGNQSKNN